MKSILFVCNFSAIGPRGGRISRRFRVHARDSYQATDIIVERIGIEYGSMTHPTFRFNRKIKLSTSSISARVARNAGPDEQ